MQFYKSNKKIIAVIMAIIIMITSPLVVNRQAKVTATEWAWLLKPVVAGGGMTVGGIVALTLSVVAVAYGVCLVIENADDIAKGFERFCDKVGDTVSKLWMQDVKKDAVNVDDGTIIDNNIDVDLYRYKSTKKEILLTPTLKNTMTEYIKYSYGVDVLNPGKYGKELGDSVVEKIIELIDGRYLSNKETDLKEDIIRQICSRYKYVIVTKYNDGDNYIVLNGADDMETLIKYEGSGKSNYLIFKGNCTEIKWRDYGQGYYNSYTNTYTNGTSAYAGYTSWGYVFDYIEFSTIDLDYEDGYGGIKTVMKTWTKPVELSASSVALDMDKDTFINGTQKVDVSSKYVLETLANADAQGITTDKIMTLVDKANQDAIRDGEQVINVPIVTPVSDVTPGFLNGWLDKLIDKLKELFEWLFVPDNVAVQEIVDEMQAKIDNQAGILTYPLALVIKFLNRVLNIKNQDCILQLPKIQMPNGYVLYNGTTFNFTQFIRDGNYEQIYGIYKIIVKAIIVLAYIKLAVRKGEEILRGGVAQ